jgi:hypothetical protein
LEFILFTSRTTWVIPSVFVNEEPATTTHKPLITGLEAKKAGQMGLNGGRVARERADLCSCTLAKKHCEPKKRNLTPHARGTW